MSGSQLRHAERGMKKLETSVVICGAGPVGLTLAHLLGAQSVNVILIEKLEGTVTEPRAIAIDGESLRTLQQVGLLEGFESELLSGVTAQYVNGEGVQLFQVGSPEQRPYGYSTINSFDQPALDRYLAQRLEQRSSVRLLFGTKLEHCEQSAGRVRVVCTDAQHNAMEITADYLVGCDGGRSTVRSLLGVKMHGESNPQPWLVIDTVDPYLDNQLDCRFFCDPTRPGMTIRKRHGERRWEWMLMPGEDRETLLQDANIRAIISAYTDAKQVNIYRKRVYDFHAIIADRWQDGRVFLAGDAAHMTPPFAGQGLNSGFRDVTNLGWKLAAVVKDHAEPAILDSYELERKDHARELIDTALNLGEQIQPIDPEQAAERDSFFAQLNKDPLAMQGLEDEMFSSLLMRSVEKGLAVDGNTACAAGRLMVQPEVVAQDGATVLLDECLGSTFSIIGYACDPTQVLDKQTLALWTELGATVVAIAATGDHAAKGWLIDKSGALGQWIEAAGPAILLVRPDRFCMMAAPPLEARDKLKEAYALLRPKLAMQPVSS